MNEKGKNLLEDVNVYRGATGGMSDHYLVEEKVCVLLLVNEWDRIRNTRVLSVEEE